MKEIDLALWRSAEAIANDKREFMNDGEWELLSIPSRYWQIHQDETDYAHIQFNVLIVSIITFIIKKIIKIRKLENKKLKFHAILGFTQVFI